MTASGQASDRPPHVPVLLRPLLAAVAPVTGIWVDGTFGAGGYARGLLDAGADVVIGIDRDPLALQMAQGWAPGYGARLRLVAGTFSNLDRLAGEPLDGVVLDLGVSSMQLDQAERGFSFAKDGPLDMRMSQEGESAADLVEHHGGRDAGRHPLPVWRRAGLAPHSAGDCRGAGRCANCHDASVVRDRLALPATPQTRTKPSGDAQFPGHPHRGEHGIQRTGRGVDGRRARAETGRQAGRRDLSFAGGSDRQALPSGPVGWRVRMPTAMPLQTRPTPRALPWSRRVPSRPTSRKCRKIPARALPSCG